MGERGILVDLKEGKIARTKKEKGDRREKSSDNRQGRGEGKDVLVRNDRWMERQFL